MVTTGAPTICSGALAAEPPRGAAIGSASGAGEEDVTGRVDDATGGAAGETESPDADDRGDTGAGTGETPGGAGEPGARAGETGGGAGEPEAAEGAGEPGALRTPAGPRSCRCAPSALASRSGDGAGAATPSFIDAVFATSDTAFIIGAPQFTQ
jgi:hypothetical protein